VVQRPITGPFRGCRLDADDPDAEEFQLNNRWILLCGEAMVHRRWRSVAKVSPNVGSHKRWNFSLKMELLKLG
jgi:hypothetical protein